MLASTPPWNVPQAHELAAAGRGVLPGGHVLLREAESRRVLGPLRHLRVRHPPERPGPVPSGHDYP